MSDDFDRLAETYDEIINDLYLRTTTILVLILLQLAAIGVLLYIVMTK